MLVSYIGWSGNNIKDNRKMDNLEKTNGNLISVIIPVYNGEKYLSECLDSVLNQTYQNLEIIIVNDGSSDDTKLILEDYLKRDNRITLLDNKESMGVSEARNSGIKTSDGNYICFIDADDVVKNDYIERLCSEMDDDADVVCCGYYEVQDDIDNVLKEHTLPNKTLKKVDESYSLYSDCLTESVLMQAVWGKIFRKELFDNISFEPLIVGEDEVLFVNVMISNAVIKTMDYVGYYYRFHSDSSLSEANTGIVFAQNNYKAKFLIAKRMESVSEYCKKQSAYNFKKEVIYNIYRLKRWDKKKNVFFGGSEVVRGYRKKLFRMCKPSLKEKIIILAYSYCPSILWRVL